MMHLDMKVDPHENVDAGPQIDGNYHKYGLIWSAYAYWQYLLLFTEVYFAFLKEDFFFF